MRLYGGDQVGFVPTCPLTGAVPSRDKKETGEESIEATMSDAAAAEGTCSSPARSGHSTIHFPNTAKRHTGDGEDGDE